MGRKLGGHEEEMEWTYEENGVDMGGMVWIQRGKEVDMERKWSTHREEMQ